MSKASIAYRIGAPGMITCTFGVGPLPQRKRLCLYVIEDTILTPLAYFRTNDDAAKAVLWLERLVESAAKSGIEDTRDKP